MKKIKLKHNTINPNSVTFLADYLVTCGIKREDTDSFIHEPKESDEDNPFDLDNMNNAIHIMQDKINQNCKFFLQVDSDVDGFTSSAIFYSYFKKRFPNIEIKWRLQEGKEHGVITNTVPNEYEVVIIPDAGSMQYEEQETLSLANKTVIILDHHTVVDFKTFKNVIVVNNQISANFSNKALSGAGIVYMFIKAFDITFFPNNYIYKDYMDLAALGIVSDMMDTRTVGNNYLIHNGFKHITNKIFRELLMKQSYSIANVNSPNKIDIAFYIAPLINGLIRSGAQEEKELLFQAMLNNEDSSELESESRGELRVETLYQKAARIAANAKARQDAAKKRGVEFLTEKIDKEKLNNNKILAIPLTEKELSKVNKNMTGLIAMDLVKTYNKPVLVLRETTDDNKQIVYSGSGRSKDFDGLDNFLGFIRESHLAEFVEGHGNAFGASFSKTKLQDFLSYSNNSLANIDFSNELSEVDYWFVDEVNAPMLKQFAEGKDIYGAGIPQPKFAFSITVVPSNVRAMGEKSSSMSIFYKGISFVLFKTATEYLTELNKNNFSRINLVGRSQLNTYMGNTNIQIVIDSLEITPIQQKKLEDLI